MPEMFGPAPTVLLRLKEQAKLTSLRVRMSTAEEPRDFVVLELESEGKPAGRWRLSLGDLSLPPPPNEPTGIFRRLLGPSNVRRWMALRGIFDKPRLAPAANLAALPEGLITPLKAFLDSYLDGPDRLLWFELGDPEGELWVLPWEPLLQKPLGVRVLRLPQNLVKPIVSTAALEIVVCCSAASARDGLSTLEVVRILGDISASVPPKSRIHVFADNRYRSELRGLPLNPESAETKVVLHEPEEAFAVSSVPGIGTEAELPTDVRRAEHPWTHWMRHALGGIAVDATHFVCSARSLGERSYLVVAMTPLGSADVPGFESVRFVGSDEVQGLLARLGAASVFFTTPGDEASLIALRHMVERLIRRRPGPLVLHDPVRDVNRRGLKETYAFLYGGDGRPLPGGDAITLYCHPWKTGGSQKIVASPTGKRYAQRVVREALNAPATPDWVAMTQRFIEVETSHCLQDSARTPSEAAAKKGTEDALRFISQALTRSLPGSKPPGAEE
jgi:hypothetical protein